MTVVQFPNKTENSRIGLIAGSGQFPLLFAHAARQTGVQVVAVGFDGETDPALGKFVEELHFLKLGQLSRLIHTFHKAGVSRVAMAGAINKTKLYSRIRPDWRAFKLIHRLRKKNDDFLLRAIAEELESEGIHIEPSTLFLPSLLAPEGVLTRRKPNQRERSDIEYGWEMAKAIGRLDIGQCLVVKDQAVLAVEGIDGTDATIIRGGRLCRKGAVVIKVSKPMQDLRFDIPSVGLMTIQTMNRVNASVLVFETGKTLMFDRDRMIDVANEAGICIIAKSSEGGKAVVDEQGSAADIEEPAYDLRPEKRPPQTWTASPVLVRRAAPGSLRTAVVGVGYLGRFHAQKYAGLPDAELLAVADLEEERARSLADTLQTKAIHDYRELLGKVDAVSIVTPTPRHYEIARDFLSAGVHVLLEKPMTSTLEEAEHLVELAREKGCILQVGHLERFNPAFRAVSPHVRRPLFIESDRLALFNERGLEVDVILDLMIHDIDIALHLINAPVRNIHATGVHVLTSLPDIASVRLEFENGALANLTASRISIKNLRKIRIFQENCYLVADYAKKRAFSFLREDEPDEAGFPQISTEELEVEERDSLQEEIISFLDTIRTGGTPVVDGVQGCRALAVALEISHKIGNQIRENGIGGKKGLHSLSECR